MLHTIDPTKTRSWTKLSAHFETMRRTHMKDLFAADPGRAGRFSFALGDIFVD
ncbi:MAG: hypothetical protein HY770_04215, partial [Chitinivibrionia bacterium]|nr:hypothetical protein [Chitinivibrionia bacterium]